MSVYTATVVWERNDQDFLKNTYSRGHVWKFDGGAEVEASSSPQVVPVPLSVEAFVDPEEAFIASLSSCHMLFFLFFAGKRKFVVDRYEDQASGVVGKNDQNKIAVNKVTLNPVITFSGEKQPTREQLEKLHHQAHQNCFIANSVKTEIDINIPD